MVDRIDLWPEAPQRRGGRVYLECRLEGALGLPRRLWYAVDEDAAPWLSPRADAWMLSGLFPAMRAGAALVVHGPVSPSLIASLELFQRLWAMWAPQTYRVVPLDGEACGDAAPRDDEAILAFSGGVDSCFSAHRSARGAGARARVAAGLTVHGFDVPLSDADPFARVRAKAARLLRSLGIAPLAIATNVRDLPIDWNHAHGAATAAALHWFSGRFAAGVVASTMMLGRPARPFGSQLLTDPLLGSLAFPILHDGAEVPRIEKIAALARWPEAAANLRVCWEGPARDENCGVCEKCIRTKLEYLACGASLPQTLWGVPTAEEIRGWTIREPWQVRQIDQILERAARSGLSDAPWIPPLLEKRRDLRRRARRQALAVSVSRLIPWRARRI